MISAITSGMRLHFPWDKVAKALAEIRHATSVRPLYGTDTGPGLWLIGDQGVYLMPNTTAQDRTIVYARECDPTALDFHSWWDNKRASFGSDDGIVFIDLKPIDRIVAQSRAAKRRPRYLFIDIAPEILTLGML